MIYTFCVNIYKTFKEYYNNQDNQQKVNMTVSFTIESFRIVMGSLLIMFIPQTCNDHVCTFIENLYNYDPYNIFVVICNFLTLFYFIILYYIELTRENWMIKHLDYNNNENEYHLYNYVKEYSKLYNKLLIHNKKYAITYFYLKYIFIFNFIFSSIIILKYNYLDYSTVSGLLTNLILCWNKVIKGNSLAYRSMKEGIGLSYYNINYISFNAIDPKYKKSDEKLMTHTKFNSLNINEILKLMEADTEEYININFSLNKPLDIENLITTI
jgi:hypothetical protein